jgi:hypothetical protein
LTPVVDQVNMSTACDKSELELGGRGPKQRYDRVADFLLTDAVRTLGRRLSAPFRRLQPVYIRQAK